MKRMALIVVVMVFCAHCTRGEPTAENVSVKAAHTGTIVVRHIDKNLSPDGKHDAQKAFIDHGTGRWVSSSEYKALTDSEPAQPFARSASVEEMEEMASPVPGGGVMIHLKGRFRNPLAATAESNGLSKINPPARDRME